MLGFSLSVPTMLGKFSSFLERLIAFWKVRNRASPQACTLADRRGLGERAWSSPRDSPSPNEQLASPLPPSEGVETAGSGFRRAVGAPLGRGPIP